MKGRMPMTIRVAIAGCRGKMGKEAVNTVVNQEGMELVAALDYKHVGESLAELEAVPTRFRCTDLFEFKTIN